jgi:aminomethyltransferase
VAPGDLKKTGLFQQHQDLKARMMGFGGWDMPVQYQGITAEHQCVRQQAGMFDISHMGKFLLLGKDLRQQLQVLVPSDLGQLEPGQAKYSVFLNPQAGIVDDLIFYYEGKNEAGLEQGKLIVNASTTDKDRAWLLDHCSAEALGFQDVSAERVLIAVQGPQAVKILQTLTPTDLSVIGNYRHQTGTILENQGAWFARTGYTGEDGFEIMVTPEVGRQLWQTLLEHGVAPCGLGARDTLRLEAAMALYGQDINDRTTPLEAGLNWLLNFDGDFVGRAALKQQQESGVARRLVGLQMEGRNIARHDYPVCVEGQTVGTVTSGSFSPTLGVAIALAYIPLELAQIGQSVTVEIRGKQCPATVVKRPFYRRPK